MIYFLPKILQDQRGNISIIAAVIFPTILLLVGGVVDYGQGTIQKQKLQAAADAAGLAAAKEYNLATTEKTRFASVVAATIRANLQDEAVKIETKVTTKPITVQVNLTQESEAIFLKDFYPSQISVSATAKLMSGTPLCVLGLADSRSGTLTLEENAKLTGNGCAVYSNSTSEDGIVSKNGATLAADLICSAGGRIGTSMNFAPEPLTDCPTMEDPLADRPAPKVGACDFNDTVIGEVSKYSTGLIGNAFALFGEIKDETAEIADTIIPTAEDTSEHFTLSPGVYCGGLKIGGNVTVNLQPGVYIMKDGPLHVSKGGSIVGEGVGFYLTGFTSVFFFGPDTSVKLTAPTSGDLAGLLFFEDRSSFALRQFTILSDDARTLVGTIYLPKAFLFVDADRPIADLSAYTAIIVQRLSLFAGPHLVLNTDYSATDVPVDSGISGVDAEAYLSN